MKLYFIVHGYVGNCLYFWASESKGYTCDISKAQLYTKEQAEINIRNDEFAIPYEDVMNGVRLMADAQYVSGNNKIKFQQ